MYNQKQKTVRLVIAERSSETGQHLSTALRDLGVNVGENADALVSYGVRLGYSAVPVLNAHAGMADKYEQLLTLRSAGVPVPKIYEAGQPIKFPLLARKRRHVGGKDLMVVFQPEEIPWRTSAGAEYFTEYIPIKSELRTWVFRGSHCATYRKVMARPHEYKKVGWNYKNGFVFDLIHTDEIPRGAVEEAMKSIRALSLDFGAVDILQGLDGNFYVLEVNTAPGAESPTRQGVQGFARHIQTWVNAGFPKA